MNARRREPESRVGTWCDKNIRVVPQRRERDVPRRRGAQTRRARRMRRARRSRSPAPVGSSDRLPALFYMRSGRCDATPRASARVDARRRVERVNHRAHNTPRVRIYWTTTRRTLVRSIDACIESSVCVCVCMERGEMMVGLHGMYVHHDDGLHEMFTTAYLSTPATRGRTRRGGTKPPIVTQKARDSRPITGVSRLFCVDGARSGRRRRTTRAAHLDSIARESRESCSRARPFPRVPSPRSRGASRMRMRMMTTIDARWRETRDDG